jgi:hypothetical protein
VVNGLREFARRGPLAIDAVEAPPPAYCSTRWSTYVVSTLSAGTTQPLESTMNPDRGFGTLSNRPMNTRQIAVAKVAAMSAAAGICADVREAPRAW